MKTPPRARKCLDVIDMLETNLEYFMEAGDEFRKLKNNEIKYLRDYVQELSLEKKVQDIKLAVKIKKELSE